MATPAATATPIDHGGPDFAPGNLRVEVMQGVVTLNWDALAQGTDSVTGYEVLRRRPL